MITNDKKKKKKNPPQQTIVNVFQLWTTCKEQYNNYFYTGIYMYMSINVNGKKKKKVSNLEIQSTSILCVQLSISLVYLLFPLYIQFLQQRCFCCELQAGNKIKIADKVNENRYLKLILKRFRYHRMLYSFLTNVHSIHFKFAKCYETQVFKIS